MSQKFVLTLAGSTKNGVVYAVGRAHRDGQSDALGKVIASTNPDNPIQFVAYPQSFEGTGMPSGTYRSMRRACIALDRFERERSVLTAEQLAALAASTAPVDNSDLWEPDEGEVVSGSALDYIGAALAGNVGKVGDAVAQADAVAEGSFASDLDGEQLDN